MVRMLKPGEIQEAEYSFDPAAEAKRDEADFQARWGTEGASAADNKKTNNKGGVLPLHTHQKDRHRYGFPPCPPASVMKPLAQPTQAGYEFECNRCFSSEAFEIKPLLCGGC